MRLVRILERRSCRQHDLQTRQTAHGLSRPAQVRDTYRYALNHTSRTHARRLALPGRTYPHQPHLRSTADLDRMRWNKSGIACSQPPDTSLSECAPSLVILFHIQARWCEVWRSRQKDKTYNRRDSQMVTHSSTSRPVQCLCMAERTGCPVLTDLWSYVLKSIIRHLRLCRPVRL